METSRIITKDKPLVVTVGTYEKPKDVLDEVRSEGYEVSDLAKMMVKDALTPLEERQKIRLVAPTPSDLEFFHNPSTEEIIERATNFFGLKRIPAEAMPKLRLAYPNQPDGERCIGMHEPLERNDTPKLLSVSNHNKKWLSVAHQLDSRWRVGYSPRIRFVFACDL